MVLSTGGHTKNWDPLENSIMQIFYQNILLNFHLPVPFLK